MRVIVLVTKAPEAVAVESQQAVLRANPQETVSTLHERGDHAIRNLVETADGFQRPVAKVETGGARCVDRARRGEDSNRKRDRAQHPQAPCPHADRHASPSCRHDARSYGRPHPICLCHMATRLLHLSHRPTRKSK